jgi:hypothetical protein
MSPKLTIAGALALLAPLVPASAYAQGWPAGGYPPPYGATQGYTEVRVAPPSGGVVYVYDGHRLLGRFDRPGSVLVPTGRAYRVVALRGDTQIWAGNVTASGSPVDLSWSAQARTREPNTPYGYPAAPPEGTYATPPPAEPPPYTAPSYGPQVMPSHELRGLLREMDNTGDDQDRLDALAAAVTRHSFASPQADWILSRFRSDAYRLAALERLRDHLVDREDTGILLQRFRSPGMRMAARELLGY